MNKIRFLKDKIMLRIDLKKDTVFLRKDFEDLGGYDQIGRELKNLAREGKIIKIGYGLYAKAEISPFNGELIPQKNLPALAREALTRLGVEMGDTFYEQLYKSGKSNQVLTGRAIGVKSRVVRKIGYGGSYINYEYIAAR